MHQLTVSFVCAYELTISQLGVHQLVAGYVSAHWLDVSRFGLKLWTCLLALENNVRHLLAYCYKLLNLVYFLKVFYFTSWAKA